jgi:hypothetical protein
MFAAVLPPCDAICVVLENAGMSKRDWMYALAYGAIFVISGAMLAHNFL